MWYNIVKHIKALSIMERKCALYLKKLRNKGVRILGLRFEESAYSRQLLKEIELRYERERAALCATLPEAMHQEFFGELYNEEKNYNEHYFPYAINIKPSYMPESHFHQQIKSTLFFSEMLILL